VTGRAPSAAAPARIAKRATRSLILLTVGMLLAVTAVPFALNLAGDAQVHLAIAEAFAAGRPFQYNPGGEIVVASTSPFWTLLLTLYFRLAGPLTPALLSLTAVAFWLATGYLLYRVARDVWRMRGVALWAVVLLWLGHTTIVANALGGLENVAAALQLLLLYWLTADRRRTTADRRPPTAGGRRTSDDRRRTTGDGQPSTADGRPLTVARGVAIGLVLGWALLTADDSPQTTDGGRQSTDGARWSVVGGRRSGDFPSGGGRRSAISGLFLIATVAAAVLAPWFLYQYRLTGNLLTDSSLARLYNGRMGALPLIPDLLYLHPKALVSLATAFLPLGLGFLVTAGALAGRFRRARGARLAFYRAEFPRVAAVLLVVAGVLFYTFVVGAEAFGRYFLPLFPFFFLTGVDGLRLASSRLAAVGRQESPRRRSAVIFVTLAALFLVATSALDLYRRLGPGRFAPETALDVIAGPANLRYYAANVPWLVGAPGRRAELTGGFLRDLGAPPAGGVSIAVTEVQLRYFLDERVTVLSLDGRTSADILAYVDPASGVPDFERYFLAARPDYVHAAQWCAVGGWLAGFLPADIADNLVCAWEQRAATMAPGESFTWQGHPVTLVAPGILHIDWDM